MEATKSLRLPKQRTNVFDCGCVQIGHGQIQVVQLCVVLDEVLEAGDDLQVEVCQLSLFLSLYDFIRNRTDRLLLEQLVIR